MESENVVYSKFFEVKTRSNGEVFYCLKDGAPENIKDFVRDVHVNVFYDCLPNDWVHDIIHEAFLDLEEIPFEDCCVEQDSYNGDLLRWLADNGGAYAIEFCNEAMQEGIACNDIVSIVGMGQCLAKEKVYREVNDFLEECQS